MANWAFTDYTIEGPIETLRKIYNAIKEHPVQEKSDEKWEGNVIIALNGDINWKPKEGHYLRGFINKDSYLLDEEKGILMFDAEEAWGVTDFDEELKKLFPDIKVYWESEEPGEGIYVTNDKEAKYFKHRFCIDTCVNGNYESGYFKYKSDVFKWLHDITDGKVNTEEKVEEFNDKADEEDSEDFIHIFEYKVV